MIPPKQNSAFVACMENVLDVYKRPYDANHPVVCMDESPKQLTSSVKAPIPMNKGKDKRVDYEYIRHGTVNVFMANEPLKGKRLVEVTSSKKKPDWSRFIRRICDEMYPDAQKITLVMDNLNTHNASALYETFKPKEAKRIWDRFEFVYTPKHGSWLNMAEIALHSLNTQCLDRHFESKQEVVKEVEAWQKNRNENEMPINWQFTNEMARVKLKKLYPSFHA